MASSNRFGTRRLVVIAIALFVGWAAQEAGFDLTKLGLSGQDTPAESRGGSPGSEPAPPYPLPVSGSGAERPGSSEANADSSASAGVARIERAFANHESGFMVTVDARVEKMLRDDNDGSRHQRFLIQLTSGRTILVAHNIDLADRAPIGENDHIRIRGQYEWNDRGGVLHWTHHDPDGRHPGGWIEFQGERVE